ncbi:hypothetical protein HN937_18050 [Candidatus Poribacteria bacterium]|jgi:hypothetical protein|nr:hypothetical protein [Candidatus Poribacteria bacterium]
MSNRDKIQADDKRFDEDFAKHSREVARHEKAALLAQGETIRLLRTIRDAMLFPPVQVELVETKVREALTPLPVAPEPAKKPAAKKPSKKAPKGK